MRSAPRVLVVGAGLVGRCVAYFLSQRRIEVELLESGSGVSPTTRASLGVLTHFNGGDNPYSRLYREGHALHRELAAALRRQTGIDVGWRPLGGIDLVFDEAEEEEARRVLAFNLERGCRAEWVGQAHLRALEPHISPRALGGVYFPGDHRVDPPRLAASLLQAARQQGARITFNAPVQAFEESTSERVRLRTGAGVREADFAVLTAGAWTAELGRQLGARIPVRPVRGQHSRFAGGGALRHVLRWAGRHLVPARREIIAGATVEEVGFALGTTPEARGRFERAFVRMLDLKPALVGSRAGLRPKPRGGRPLLGPLGEHPRVFAAAGHYKNGILLGPISGRILAQWIAAGRPGRDMGAFAPER